MTTIYYEYTDDDIYMPDKLQDEVRFIVFMLKYILTHQAKREKEWLNLSRQVSIYLFAMKNNFICWFFQPHNCIARLYCKMKNR